MSARRLVWFGIVPALVLAACVADDVGPPEVTMAETTTTSTPDTTTTTTTTTTTVSPWVGRITFVSDRDGNGEVYVMDADGTNQTRLTNSPAVDGFPAWSAAP